VLREYEMRADEADVSLWFERSVTPGLGLFGGQSGTVPKVIVDPDLPSERLLLKVNHLPVQRGTVIRAITGGGGGYGLPTERSPEALEADIANGYITPDSATRDYR
jgi:N-methylhydantoinase B